LHSYVARYDPAAVTGDTHYAYKLNGISMNVQVVETECDQTLHSSPKQYQRQQQYTQQNEQRCFIRTQRNNISITYATISLDSVLSAISIHIPLSQFQPLKSTQILHYKYFHLHFNSTSKFSQDSFQEILCVSYFPSQLGGISSPLWLSSYHYSTNIELPV
jgi:hypothetical protein